MPPKKGKTMDISMFIGDSKNELPTGPMARDESEGGYYNNRRTDRGGGEWGGRRDDRRDDGPAASDTNNDWRGGGRQTRPTSSFGGGSSFGGRRDEGGFARRDEGGFGRRDDRPARGGGDAGDSGNWRRGGVDNKAPDRFTSDRSNRFDAMGTRDNTWGPGPRDGSRDTDTRPAHLRNMFKKNDSAQDVRSTRTTGTQDPRYQSAAQDLPSAPAATAARAAPDGGFARRPAKAEVVPEKKRRPRDIELAPELQQKSVVAGDGLHSALEKAIKNRTSINEEGLIASFQQLDLGEYSSNDAGVVIANSLVDKKITGASIAAAVRETKGSPDVVEVVWATCRVANRKGKAARTLLTADKEATQTIVTFLRGTRNENDFLAELQAHELLFLNPVPDCSAEVEALLASGGEADALLALLRQKLPAGRTAPNLKPLIVNFALEKAFATKPADIKVVDAFAAVFALCLDADVDHEVDLVFAAQSVWFRAGAEKATALPLFQKLHELKVVSFDGLCTWRDDRTQRGRKENKAGLLIAVNSWITDITPAPEEEADEEDGGGEGDAAKDEIGDI